MAAIITITTHPMQPSVRTATNVRSKNEGNCHQTCRVAAKCYRTQRPATNVRCNKATGFIAVLLRLSVDEFSAVEEAAKQNRESVQQYIRDALGLRLYKEKREAYREEQM